MYPQGTEFGNYFLAKEQNKTVIRRWAVLPNGKKAQPRYPYRLYKHLSQQQIEELLNRLNYREDAEKKRNIEYRTSFIPGDVMEAFRDHLKVNIPNEKNFRYSYNTLLKRYFLGFFVGKLGLLDPKEWIKHQEKWAASLLSKSDNPDHNVFEIQASDKTIKHVIQMANRFMAFLHQKMPADYPMITFDPLSIGALKAHRAEQNIEAKPIGKFIPDEDWKTIKEALPDSIAPFIQLMYYYGLRRSESLGFSSTDSVKKGFLLVSKQMASFTNGEPRYATLKDRESRSTPHWFASPREAYALITAGMDSKMHPDTLSCRWDSLMADLGFDYKTHDLRRTFITRALRVQNPRDVQMAVGHASLVTTERYAQDDREMDSDTFVP